MSFKMIKVCSWCGKTMGEIPCSKEQDGMITHAICEGCFKKTENQSI